MAESDFQEKFVSPENAGNMPEIAVSAYFLWTVSTYFVVFSHKNISDITFSFVRSIVHSYFNYQVSAISMWLVCFKMLTKQIVEDTLE